MRWFLAVLKRARDAGKKTARAALPDALIVAGAAAVAYGAWLIYPAAGFVAGGVLSIVGGVLVARSD